MVEEAGGIEAYVELWLDLEAAQNPKWTLAEAQSRQGDLFA